MKLKLKTTALYVQECESSDEDLGIIQVDRTFDDITLYDGVSSLKNNEYIVSGNFSLEELKNNIYKVYLPHYTYDNCDGEYLMREFELVFLEAFLDEEKAKNSIKILELVQKANDYKNKTYSPRIKDLKEITEQIKLLGGKTNVHLKQVEKEIYYLDEKSEEKAVDYDASRTNNQISLYVTHAVEMKEKKKKIK